MKNFYRKDIEKELKHKKTRIICRGNRMDLHKFWNEDGEVFLASNNGTFHIQKFSTKRQLNAFINLAIKHRNEVWFDKNSQKNKIEEIQNEIRTKCISPSKYKQLSKIWTFENHGISERSIKNLLYKGYLVKGGYIIEKGRLASGGLKYHTHYIYYREP